LTQCQSASRQRTTVEKGTPAEKGTSASSSTANPNITFLRSVNRAYNQDKWNPVIARIIKDLENEWPCESAFDAAGIDLKQLLDHGIIIASADIMGAGTAEGLTLSEAAKKQGQRIVDDPNVPAFTTTNFQGWPQTVTDGKPHIFLNAMAFSGGEPYLREVLAHELVHAGGFPPKKPGFVARLLGGQDLDYMGSSFRNIMKACAR
jgi:hypothetical protein